MIYDMICYDMHIDMCKYNLTYSILYKYIYLYRTTFIYLIFITDTCYWHTIPSGYLTWPWKMAHLKMIFPAINHHWKSGFSMAIWVITRWYTNTMYIYIYTHIVPVVPDITNIHDRYILRTYYTPYHITSKICFCPVRWWAATSFAPTSWLDAAWRQKPPGWGPYWVCQVNRRKSHRKMGKP